MLDGAELPEPVNDGLLQSGQIRCVDFTCLHAAHGPSASITGVRCPTTARAETTLSGATPIFRARHIAHRATPRMASDTASASVLMTGTVRRRCGGDMGPWSNMRTRGQQVRSGESLALRAPWPAASSVAAVPILDFVAFRAAGVVVVHVRVGFSG